MMIPSIVYATPVDILGCSVAGCIKSISRYWFRHSHCEKPIVKKIDSLVVKVKESDGMLT